MLPYLQMHSIIFSYFIIFKYYWLEQRYLYAPDKNLFSSEFGDYVNFSCEYLGEKRTKIWRLWFPDNSSIMLLMRGVFVLVLLFSDVLYLSSWIQETILLNLILFSNFLFFPAVISCIYGKLAKASSKNATSLNV